MVELELCVVMSLCQVVRGLEHAAGMMECATGNMRYSQRSMTLQS